MLAKYFFFLSFYAQTNKLKLHAFASIFHQTSSYVFLFILQEKKLFINSPIFEVKKRHKCGKKVTFAGRKKVLKIENHLSQIGRPFVDIWLTRKVSFEWDKLICENGTIL